MRNSKSAVAWTTLAAALCVVGVLVSDASGRGTDTGQPLGTEVALYPIAHASHVGKPFKVTAFIVEREPGESEQIVGQNVKLLVISGPNAGKTLTEVTDETGAAHFSYTSQAAGTDLLQASWFDTSDDATACTNFTAQTWVPVGSPLPKPPPGPTTPPPPTSTSPPTSGNGPVAGAQPLVGCRAPALVKTPGAADFSAVQTGQTLPPGTLVDVSGESSLTIQKPTGQQMTFFGAPDNVPSQFAITSTQNQGTGLITIALAGGDFRVCTGAGYRYIAVAGAQAKPKPSPPAKKPKPVRRLWGSGKGSYKTTGKYASATLRGTYWVVEDYCNGTLIRVRNGSVIVYDRIKHKTIIVKPGKPYFAAGKP